MGRQRNVQLQVTDRAAEMRATARAFMNDPQAFEWLRALLATYGRDARAGILLEHRSVPDQGCWVHYGIWLTAEGRFLKFTADEAYGDRPLERSGRLDDAQLDDVTEQTSVSAHVPGIGKSFGWLALDVLRQLGMAKPE